MCSTSLHSQQQKGHKIEISSFSEWEVERKAGTQQEMAQLDKLKRP